MKLILSLALVCTLCVTGSLAVTCLQCTSPSNPTCLLPITVACSSGQVCLNAFMTVSEEGVVTERIFRDCVNPRACPSDQDPIINANTGGAFSRTNATCCDTDACNNEVLTFPAIEASNGKMCPGTNLNTSTLSSEVQCRGAEDTCLTALAITPLGVTNVGACGTSNICNITDELDQLPFIEGALVRGVPLCTPIPTTTTETPTTTTETTIATTETTTPTKNSISRDDLLNKFKFLLAQLKILSAGLKIELLKQQKAVLFGQHTQMLNFQQQLLFQQQVLPIDHYNQLPLYYQQCLLVNYQRLLFHQIHLSLFGQQNFVVLFQKQQLVLQKMEALLHGHHHQMLPYYNVYLQGYYDKYRPKPTTTEEPTTTTEEPPTTTEEPPTTTTITPMP